MAKGIRLAAPREIKIDTVDMPDLKGDDVLLRVRKGGICGSDIHIFDGTHPIGGYPKIIGHEFAGSIVETGEYVTNLEHGDSVVVNPLINCGSCYACTKLKRPNVCSRLKVMGVHLDGGFSTQVVVPASSVHKFQNMSWTAATLVEPFTIAAQIVERSRLSSEDSVLIIGAGTIGLATTMLAERIGAKIAASDLFGSHLTKAGALGAELTVNARDASFNEKLLEFTGGDGFSVVVDSVGNSPTLETALEYAAPGARVVVIGFDQSHLSVSPFDITYRELEIIGSRLQTYKFESIVKLFDSGEIKPEQIVSHTYRYEDANTVFPFIVDHPEAVIKVQLEF